MPFLDVDAPLFDPDFTDTFTVNRRVESLSLKGRSTLTSQLFPNVIGVVTAVSPSDLDRADGYQAMTRSISVVTQFRLRGEVVNEQPDIIIWRGDNYVVKHIDPYPQFGQGFYQVEATSMDRVDVAFNPTPPGQFDFSASSNSFLMPLG